MPALIPTATPTAEPSLSPSPVEESTPEQRPSAAGEGAVNSLELARSPEPELKIGQEPRVSATPVPKIGRAAPRPDGSRKLDPNAKRQLIAEFKKEIDGVFAEVKNATNNFQEVERLDQVRSLPKSASAHVTLLTASASEFRAIVGYEVTFYECLAEMQTVDALLVVDQATSIIAAKDAPIARKTLAAFRNRYSKPPGAAQKPLWQYIDSLFALCDRLKNEAEARLPRARSLESEGKKADALREYRAINQIYPNKVTAERIRLLEAQSH